MRAITCTRNADGTAECSIPQRHVHHSPTGFGFGYGGSGPADLALNIMALAIGPPPDPIPEPVDADGAAWDAWADVEAQRVELHDGSVVHRDAWDLHQPFKWELIATMPRAGGTIAGAVIEAWVAAKRARLRDAEAVD